MVRERSSCSSSGLSVRCGSDVAAFAHAVGDLRGAGCAGRVCAGTVGLGARGAAPSDAELAEQAIAAGGENVLAAVLANALYGAAIGCGMLAEGVMLEQPTDRTRRLSLARAQALKASGAEGPGFVGAMHWQAAHIAGPLRALKDREQAPLGQALAAVSWALVLLLQAMCLAEPAGSTAVEVIEALADARAELGRAEGAPAPPRSADRRPRRRAAGRDRGRAGRDAHARQRAHRLSGGHRLYLSVAATFLTGTSSADVSRCLARGWASPLGPV